MVTDIKASKQSILEMAKAEVEKEDLSRAVKLYKAKLKEQNAAQTVLDNIGRELAELELKIEQGNY